MREQNLTTDLTVPKTKPKYVGSAMSRPHTAVDDDLDYVIDPKSKEGQERALQELERPTLQQLAGQGSPAAIARLSGPACTICKRYSPFENFSNLKLNSIVESLIKEIMGFENSIRVKPMPHILNNTGLVYHVAYHHEDKVKEAARVYEKVSDARLRFQYIQEMLRRRQTALNHWHDKHQASELWLDVIEKAKIIRDRYKGDKEVIQILERGKIEGDTTILHYISDEYEIREKEPED
jgi:hypothetical protein